MGHGHGHGHSGHGASRAADRRRLRWVLGVTAAVLGVQVVGGLLTGSLALIADAAHMATDAGGVLLALGASYVASLPAGRRSTFGYHRAEVLAALANAAVLLGVCAWLVWAGIGRLGQPEEVEAGAMVLFAAAGLAANAISLAILQRGDTGSLNMRGALNEVFADLLGSVFAIVAGVVIWLTDWYRADAIASLVIATMILPRALVLLRDAAVVLLEIAPAGLDLDDVDHHLRHVDGVVDVHDLHAWTITSGIPSLSAHVTVTDEALAARGVGAVLDELCACVAEHFDVRHATFQVEPVSHGAHEDLGELH
ncbi:cation diffusion facilitator family transporter [Nocardioides sp. C4-1]|uniref:cation diffusion facilitator family transporter n=1 Tax=Nocardioides sp. C4-1 TaxID=3151851 RepID=UPI0032663053